MFNLVFLFAMALYIADFVLKLKKINASRAEQLKQQEIQERFSDKVEELFGDVGDAIRSVDTKEFVSDALETLIYGENDEGSDVTAVSDQREILTENDKFFAARDVQADAVKRAADLVGVRDESEEIARLTDELKDLLEAGIIDRAEFYERIDEARLRVRS